MELPQYMFHLLKKEGFLACIIVMPSVYPPGNERIYEVDALRGFAVMAIMLLHFLEHFIYNSYPVASSPMMEAANQQFKEVFFFLFAGKSYTIFALLFGFTFAVQYRNQAPATKSWTTLRRADTRTTPKPSATAAKRSSSVPGATSTWYAPLAKCRWSPSR